MKALIAGLMALGLWTVSVGRCSAGYMAVLDFYAASGENDSMPGIPFKDGISLRGTKVKGHARRQPRRAGCRGNRSSAERQRYIRLARTMERRYGIPRGLYVALLQHESGLDATCRGSSGEVSLAQMMPETAGPLFRSGRLRGSIWNPETNIEAGAMHISDLRRGLSPVELRYGDRQGYHPWHLVLAAYNGGKGSVAEAARENRPLPYRLTAYLNNVMGIYGENQHHLDSD